MTINCPKCNAALELPGAAIGKKVQCPFCREKFIGEIATKGNAPYMANLFRSYLMSYEEKAKKGGGDCNITDLLERDEVVANLSQFRVPIILGLDEAGNVQMCDLADPQNDAGRSNIIVAGRTGSGKSVFAKCNVASLLLKPNSELEIYIWTSHGLDFNRRFFRVPGVTIFEGCDEFDCAVMVLKKLVAFRVERVGNAGCLTLDEYNAKNPDDEMSHILFVLDGCNFAASSGVDMEKIGYFVRNTLLSGVHLIAMAQTWSYYGLELISIANLFGRKMGFGSLPEAIRGAFNSEKKFFNIAAVCGCGCAAYDDGLGNLMEIRTPYIEHQDFHRVGYWKSRIGDL